MIGRRLQEGLRCPVSTTRISTFQDALEVIQKHKPKVLINCIGHTGAGNVDDCERALDKTLTANTLVPILLAEVALRHHIKLVHISSGCIYHFQYGQHRPIQESRSPDYYNLYYSRTKIYTENVLKDLTKSHDILIVRIRVPLDIRPHKKNLLTKLFGFESVINTPNSVTYIPDFIKAIDHLIQHNGRGIYNVVCKGGLKYPDLLNLFNKHHGKGHSFKILDAKKLNLNRTNLILSTKKLEESGFKVRTPKEILEECVKEYIKSL